jgi:sulfite reductase (ferredoxin)
MAPLDIAARAAVWLPRGEGQWGMGHREPLNGHERMKRDDHPLHVRARIEARYARRGFASIDPADLRRFAWWGLRHTGGDAFALTVRGDGPPAPGLRRVARGAYRIPGVRIEQVPALWRELEARGLSTMESDGDCPVTICGRSPLIASIVDKYIGDPDLANLPNRFESSIGPARDIPYHTDDLAFTSRDGGYEVWVCGRRLGLRVAPREVHAVWYGVVQLYRDFGYRRIRGRSRMRFLVEDWGVELFLRLLREGYL